MASIEYPGFIRCNANRILDAKSQCKSIERNVQSGAIHAIHPILKDTLTHLAGAHKILEQSRFRAEAPILVGLLHFKYTIEGTRECVQGS